MFLERQLTKEEKETMKKKKREEYETRYYFRDAIKRAKRVNSTWKRQKI